MFENWARTQSVRGLTVYHPTSVQEIVAAVLEVEGRQENVKAIGSGWAYGAVAVDESTQNVIATRGLRKKLSGSDPTKGLIPFALRDALKPTATRYLHVEAGIEIWRLNCMLDEDLVAVPTLGASNGQTIAGAIATSTHGADVDAAPIADAVAAIHLVGPGGKEWWIERDKDAGAITDPARMAQAQSQGRLCLDARIEYDTSLFRAVLVSMGRMGVVYSYVLKAVDRFALTMTRNVNAKWSVERAKLQDPLKPFVDDDGKDDVRWLEIFVNPYVDATGDHPCIVTRQKVEDRSFTAAPPGAAGFIEAFCESAQITKLLIDVKAALALLIPVVTTAAATALAPLNAIPVVGPPVYAGALTLAVAAYWALDTELTILPAQGGNFAQKLATVITRPSWSPSSGGASSRCSYRRWRGPFVPSFQGRRRAAASRTTPDSRGVLRIGRTCRPGPSRRAASEKSTAWSSRSTCGPARRTCSTSSTTSSPRPMRCTPRTSRRRSGCRSGSPAGRRRCSASSSGTGRASSSASRCVASAPRPA